MEQTADRNATAVTIDPLSSFPSQLVEPQFRLACEECHSRKIRCEPSFSEADSRNCEACRQNGRRCLFSLRSKIGRPRKQIVSSNEQQPPTTRKITDLPGFLRSEMSPTMSHYHAEGRQVGWEKPPWPPSPASKTASRMKDDIGQSAQPRMAGTNLTDELSTPGSFRGASVGSLVSDELQVGDGFPGNELGIESWFFTDLNTQPGLQLDGGQGFMEALKLYGDIHNRCRTKSLDLCADEDHAELGETLSLFENLHQSIAMFQSNDFSSLLPPMDRPKWRIIRVAVIEAIELCTEVIQFNYRLQQTAKVLLKSTRCPQDDLGANNSRASDHKSTTSCNCHVALTIPNWDNQFKCLESILRLEHSFLRFRHFIAIMDCLHTGSRYNGWSTVHPSDSQPVCNCWLNAAPEIDRMRSQVSQLTERLRSQWG